MARVGVTPTNGAPRGPVGDPSGTPTNKGTGDGREARRSDPFGLRIRLLASLGAAVAVALTLTLAVAHATHDWDVIAPREVRVFRHVLEEDDRLFLARYTLSESPEEDDAVGSYGPAGAVATLYEGDPATVVGRTKPPSTGYALVAFYQRASDPTLINWASDTAELCLEGNPTLFESPQSNCLSPRWHATANAEATEEALIDALEDLMKAIQRDNPDDTQYWGNGGVLAPGVSLVEDAFPPLLAIVSEAFAVGVGATLQLVQSPGEEAPPVNPRVSRPTMERFVGTGSQTVYTLRRDHAYPNTTDLQIFIDGTEQGVGDTTFAAPRTLTFTTAPTAEAEIGVYYRASGVARLPQKDAFRGDGATTRFALTKPHLNPDATLMTVAVNGVPQETGSQGYTFSPPSTVVLSSAPADGATVLVSYETPAIRSFADDLFALGAEFGFPAPAMALMLFTGLVAALLVQSMIFRGQPVASVIWVGSVLMYLGIVGVAPLYVPFAMAALLGAAALTLIFTRWVPGS